jgi:hypothetical protein
MTLSERYQIAKAQMSSQYIILDRKSMKARYNGTCALSGKQIERGQMIVGTDAGFALLWVAQALTVADPNAETTTTAAEMPAEFAADLAAGCREEARIARAEMAVEVG